MQIDRWLVLSLFAGYTGKLLVLGANPSDAVVVLVLAGAHFLHGMHLQAKFIKSLTEELAVVKSMIIQQNSTIGELKTSVASVKMSNGIRSVK